MSMIFRLLPTEPIYFFFQGETLRNGFSGWGIEVTIPPYRSIAFQCVETVTKSPQLRWRADGLYLVVRNAYFRMTDSLIVTGKISGDRQRWFICKPLTLNLLNDHPGFYSFTYINGGYSYAALISHGIKP